MTIPVDNRDSTHDLTNVKITTQTSTDWIKILPVSKLGPMNLAAGTSGHFEIEYKVMLETSAPSITLRYQMTMDPAPGTVSEFDCTCHLKHGQNYGGCVNSAGRTLVYNPAPDATPQNSIDLLPSEPTRTPAPRGPATEKCSRLYDAPPLPVLSTTNVHQWFTCIHSKNTSDRRLAINSAPRFISESPAILDALRHAAKDSDPWVRESDFLFFIRDGRPYAGKVHPQILAGLSDPDKRARYFAAQVVGVLGLDTDPQFSHALSRDGRIDTEARAIALAYSVHPDSDTARILASAIAAPDDGNRRQAVDAFIALGQAAAPMRDTLIALLDSPDQGIQCDSMHALAAAQIASKDLIQRMIDRVKANTCPAIAAEVLGSIGPDAKSAIPGLLSRIQGTPSMCCDEYAEDAARMGPVSIPALLAVSHEKDYYRSEWATIALTRFVDSDPRAAARVIGGLDEGYEKQFRIRSKLATDKKSVRALAKTLYSRILKKRPLWVDQDDIRTLSTALPLTPNELYSSITNPEIEYKLATSKSPDGSLSAVLTAKNISTRSIRLLRTNCDPLMQDPTDFLIFQQPGWPVFRVSHTLMDVGVFTSVDDSVLLAPLQEVSFTCALSFSKSRKSDRGFDDWGYDYVGKGGESHEEPTKLQPGRYWIQARYRLTPAELKTTPYWSDELSHKYGAPWTGEVYSNRIILDVK